MGDVVGRSSAAHRILQFKEAVALLIALLAPHALHIFRHDMAGSNGVDGNAHRNMAICRVSPSTYLQSGARYRAQMCLPVGGAWPLLKP